MKRTLWTLVILGLGLTGGGCGALFRERFVEPEFDLRAQKVIVVPFRNDKLWYYEVTEGRELAKYLSVALQGDCDDYEPIGSSQIDEAILSADDPVDWSRIGRDAGADFIVLGEIIELRNTSRRMVGMLQGRLIVNIQVWDVENDSMAFGREIRTVFPSDVESGEIQPSFEQNLSELHARLFSKACKKISGLFCGKMVDKMVDQRQQR